MEVGDIVPSGVVALFLLLSSSDACSLDIVDTSFSISSSILPTCRSRSSGILSMVSSRAIPIVVVVAAAAGTPTNFVVEFAVLLFLNEGFSCCSCFEIICEAWFFFSSWIGTRFVVVGVVAAVIAIAEVVVNVSFVALLVTASA